MSQSSEMEAQIAYNKALAAHQAGNFAEAEAQYRTILKSFPKLEPVLSNLGAVLVAQDRLKEAEKQLRTALSLNPKNSDALNNLGALLLKQGKTRAALETYKNAVQANPEDAQGWYNIANVYRDSGKLDLAEDAYSKSIALNPTLASAYLNYGSFLHSLGEYAESERLLRFGSNLRPDDPGPRIALSTVLRETGRLAEAETEIRKAIAAAPAFGPAHRGLGSLLLDLGDDAAAVEAMKIAVELEPDVAEAHILLGNAWRSYGNPGRAWKCYEKALELDPGNPAAERSLRALAANKIPGWHFPMLADTKRNAAYRKAIEKAVTPDSVVLDIGSGSALLAMMAARAGAKSVVGCEMVEMLAETAMEIVRKNKLSDKVTIYSKKSTGLKVGAELPEPANVIVSEILDAAAVGEGMIPSLRHALANLAAEGVRLIPAKAQLFAQVIELPQLRAVTPMKTVEGFDLSPFERFRDLDGYQVIILDHEKWRPLSPPVPFWKIDFGDLPLPVPDADPVVEDLDLEITEEGAAQAVAIWFDLWLDDEIMVSSRPGGELVHWGQAVCWLSRDVPVKAGKKLACEVVTSDNIVHIGLR